MEEMLRVAAIAVSAVLCCTVLKKTTPEIGIVLGLAVGILIAACIGSGFSEIRNAVDELAENAGLDAELMTPVLKTVGIAVVTRITTEFCKDAKENGIAAFVEFAGALLSLLIALPLVERVLEEIGRML